jgi:hypothetical protein
MPAGVVQSSARRSIHLSLMIVDEPFTVHDRISGNFVTFDSAYLSLSDQDMTSICDQNTDRII